MIRESRSGSMLRILTALTALFAVSGGALGAAVDAAQAKRAAKGLSGAADALNARVSALEPRRNSPEGRVSALKTSAVLLCGFSDRLLEQTKLYIVTGSFIDVGDCQKTLAECHIQLLDLRREARKLPAEARKGLLKDVMASFRNVELALYGRNGRYPIPRDPLLDE